MEELDLSVVVTVYKSAGTLKVLTERLIKVLESYGDSFEILFVEDCGGDSSWQVIKELAKTDSRIRGIELTNNFGQHPATICGFENTRGKIVATMDDDMEVPPEYLPALIDKVKEGYDVVYGTHSTTTHSIFRTLASRLSRFIFKLSIPDIFSDYRSFRAMDSKIAKGITKFDSDFPFIDGYLAWISAKKTSVPVVHQERASGGSTYNLYKLVTITFRIMFTYSLLPLRIVTLIGIGVSILGFSSVAYLIYQKLSGAISVSGYTGIMASILTLGGLQLFVIGVIGEYIGRISKRVSKKPNFVIKETLNFEQNN